MKNLDWYHGVLADEYAGMRKNLPGSTTQSLVRKKGQNLKDQQLAVSAKVQDAIAAMMIKANKKGKSQPFVVDQYYEELAESNPLDYIEAVLRNHPQKK